MNCKTVSGGDIAPGSNAVSGGYSASGNKAVWDDDAASGNNAVLSNKAISGGDATSGNNASLGGNAVSGGDTASGNHAALGSPRDCAGSFDQADRIQPWSGNPRYWQYKGEPVLLLGATDQDNLFNHPDIWPFGLESHLDLMTSNGGNYIRNTMSSRDYGNEWEFGKTRDGLYDLDTWNDTYWNRFENLLRLACERDIIVQIELWDRFDFAREPWNHNPFNPENNINYTTEETGLPSSIDSHPGQRENPFFRSPPDFEDIPTVLARQQDRIEKLMSIALEYPNVLYVISNETNESPLWSDYWARFIHDLAGEAGVEIHVTEMWDAWDLRDPEHDATFNRPDLYSFVDVSQNNHQSGETHWNNALYVRNERLDDGQRPMNSVKIYGGPRHGRSLEEATHRLWRNIFAGFASSRFHRTHNPYEPSGPGLSPLAQTQLRSLRMFTDRLDVFSGEPANRLLTGRGENEAYAFAVENRQVAVYFPNPGSVELDLSGMTGRLTKQWMHIIHNTWYEPETLTGGGTVTLTPPGSGPWNEDSWVVLITSRE